MQTGGVHCSRTAVYRRGIRAPGMCDHFVRYAEHAPGKG